MENLTKDDILQIAKEHYTSQLKFRVVDGDNANLNVYRTWNLEDIWCVYVEKPDFPSGLFSSEVIILSKKTGEILYSGSANDEG